MSSADCKCRLAAVAWLSAMAGSADSVKESDSCGSVYCVCVQPMTLSIEAILSFSDICLPGGIWCLCGSKKKKKKKKSASGSKHQCGCKLASMKKYSMSINHAVSSG